MIIGKWIQSSPSGDSTLDFEPDGTLKVQFPGMPRPATGKYTITGGDTVEVDIRASVESEVGSGGQVVMPYWAAIGQAEISCSEKELVITRGNEKDIYSRAE